MSSPAIEKSLQAIEAKLLSLCEKYGRTRGEPAEIAVATLERTQNVRIPEEYRAFLLRVGEGAPKLLKLGRWAQAIVGDASLSAPCPLDDRKVFDDYEGYEDPAQGTITLTPGDICAVLVVTGDLRGRVFYYDINSYKSDVVEHVARGPVGFLDWYVAVLDKPPEWTAAGYLGTEGELVSTYFQHNADPRRRMKAVVGLALHEGVGVDALSALVAACRDADARVRLEALRGLERNKYSELSTMLHAAVSDYAPEVRREVVRLSRAMSGVSRNVILRRLVDDDDDDVVFSAVSTLCRTLPAARQVELLDHSSVRRVANAHRVILDTLGESGDARWLPILLNSLNDSSSEIRAKAAVALEKLGDPMACTSLRQRLTVEPDDTAHRFMTRAITKLEKGA